VRLRRFWVAFTVATLIVTVGGVATPALASVGQAALLARLNSDQSIIQGWVAQVGQMSYLDGKRAAILDDLSFASAAVATLRSKTISDTSAPTLGADAAHFTTLNATLIGLEGPKIRLAARANEELAKHAVLLSAIESSGGLGASSPAHSQTVALLAKLRKARKNLDQAVALIDQATFKTYPGSRALLTLARSLLDQAAATLADVDRLAVQLPFSGAARTRNQLRTWILTESLALSDMRTRVAADPNLTTGERANLISQLDAVLAGFGKLNKLVLEGTSNTTIAADLAALMSQPDCFILIMPKAEIMLAGAADRAAIQGLTALLPTLRSRIAVVAAGHHDVTALNSLLSDVVAQLAGANTDIAPIDAEFESMTATTATQLSHDGQVIESTVALLKDANSRLTTAQTDANLILSATA
jgi:hypothetical protein